MSSAISTNTDEEAIFNLAGCGKRIFQPKSIEHNESSSASQRQLIGYIEFFRTLLVLCVFVLPPFHLFSEASHQQTMV
jgi:hypothetical protein